MRRNLQCAVRGVQALAAYRVIGCCTQFGGHHNGERGAKRRKKHQRYQGDHQRHGTFMLRSATSIVNSKSSSGVPANNLAGRTRTIVRTRRIVSRSPSKRSAATAFGTHGPSEKRASAIGCPATSKYSKRRLVTWSTTGTSVSRPSYLVNCGTP